MRYIRLAAASAVFSAVSFGQPLVSGPVVVFMGPPGSGKSTQAAAAAKQLKVPVVSVEELVRDNAAELEKARTPGISGMEPQTDPLLNNIPPLTSQRATERGIATRSNQGVSEESRLHSALVPRGRASVESRR